MVAPLISLLFLLAFLAVAILFLFTLQNTLKAISPVNRKMEPGMVWLWLIPFFNLVWQFIVVKRISESIEVEYISRRLPCKSQPTYNIGLALSILNCINLVIFWSMPLRGLVSLAAIVCFIIYWVQVNDYKNKLRQLPPIEHGDS